MCHVISAQRLFSGLQTDGLVLQMLKLESLWQVTDGRGRKYFSSKHKMSSAQPSRNALRNARQQERAPISQMPGPSQIMQEQNWLSCNTCWILRGANVKSRRDRS